MIPRGSASLDKSLHYTFHRGEDKDMLTTILLVVLILLLIGALPTWPYSSGWGYYPSGILGTLLLIVLLLAILGWLSV